jgi:hypothetical protein
LEPKSRASATAGARSAAEQWMWFCDALLTQRIKP